MNIKLPAMYDTSYHEIIPDFAQVSPFPLIVSTKATEGSAIRDPKFLQYWADLKQGGIRRQAYHYHRKAVSAASQIGNFITVLKAGGVTTKDVLELDIEEGGETASQIIACLDILEIAYPQNLIILYSRKNILDPIPMTTAQAQRLRKYPIWTAGYPYNPDLYNAPPASYIPDPAKWGSVWQWQYTDKAIVTGIQGEVDANWISPAMLNWLGEALPADVMTNPAPGITQIKGTRSGYPFSLLKIDMTGKRAHLYYTHPEFVRPSAVAARTGALLATNASAWEHLSPFSVIGLTVSDGQIKIKMEPTLEPYVNTTVDGETQVKTGTASDWYNAYTGFRLLTDLDPNKPEHSQYRSARHLIAIDAQGRRLEFASEGNSLENAGLTLIEGWELLRSYGAIAGMDGDSGGSVSQVLKGEHQIIPSDPDGERYVPDVFLIFEEGNTMPTTPGTAKEKLGKTVTVRNAPSAASGTDTGQRVSPYEIIEYYSIVPDREHPSDANYQWFDMGNNRYVTWKYPRDPGIDPERFTILSSPSDQTPVTVADMPYTLTLGGGDSPYQVVTLSGIVPAKK